MKKLISLILRIIVIAALAYGVYYPDSLVMSAGLALVWAFIQLGTAYAVIGMGLLYLAERLAEPQRREALSEIQKLICEHSKYSGGIFQTWCEAIVIVMGLALTGWFLTAISFLSVVIIMKYTRHTISQSAGKWTAC